MLTPWLSWIYSSILRYLCCYHKLFHYAREVPSTVISVANKEVNKVMGNCNYRYANQMGRMYFLFYVGKRVFHRMLENTILISVVIPRIRMKLNLRHFHHTFTAPVWRGSPTLTSAYISLELQYKLCMWLDFGKPFQITHVISCISKYI